MKDGLWTVRYWATFEGYVEVEADSAEAAEREVKDGNFQVDAHGEMVDWGVVGAAESK